MTSKHTRPKKKNVKAWAFIRKGKIVDWYDDPYYGMAIVSKKKESRHVDRDAAKNTTTVPITITLTLPTKTKK